MKVTVCFGDVRVVVPCSDGQGQVKDLIEDAVARYKKALIKLNSSAAAIAANSSWFTLDNLKLLLSDGGILDWEDTIKEVIDDKEQIIVVHEDGGVEPLEHRRPCMGDGTSGSSGGTASPDLYTDRARELLFSIHEDCTDDDVIVTLSDLRKGPRLLVRRLSEPTLSQQLSEDDSLSLSGRSWHGKNLHLPATTPVISSYSTVSPELSTITADRTFVQKTPVEVNPTRTASSDNVESCANIPALTQRIEATFVFTRSSEPLGIHVVPVFDRSSRSLGLYIQSIETEGRAHSDGRLAQHDTITEINGQDLFDIEFSRAQDMFRTALLSPELRVKVFRGGTLPLPAPSTLSSPSPVAADELRTFLSSDGREVVKKVAPAAPVRKSLKVKPLQSSVSLEEASRLTNESVIQSTATMNQNGRLVVTNHSIELVKGPDGLGFSVTTHDVGSSFRGKTIPLYIKNIMSKGAAREDGRLRSGDVLLELNGESVVKKKRDEVIEILRTTPVSSSVSLVVSRQETTESSMTKRVSSRPLSTLGFSHVTPARHAGQSSTSRSTERLHLITDDVEDTAASPPAKPARAQQIQSSSQKQVTSPSPAIRPIVLGVGAKLAASQQFARPQRNVTTGSSMENLSMSTADPSSILDVTLFSNMSRKFVSMDNLTCSRQRGLSAHNWEDKDDNSAGLARGVGFVRERDVNQSFRAAVDKSYDNLASSTAASNTVPEVVVSGNKKSNASSDTTSDNLSRDNSKIRSSGGGSGKGFGWLFRFGKQRKSDDERHRAKETKKDTGHKSKTDGTKAMKDVFKNDVGNKVGNAKLNQLVEETRKKKKVPTATLR